MVFVSLVRVVCLWPKYQQSYDSTIQVITIWKLPADATGHIFLVCNSRPSPNPSKTKQKIERKKIKAKTRCDERKGSVASPPPRTAQEGERQLSRLLSQVRESHQRLRIFGTMKIFSSEFGKPRAPSKIYRQKMRLMMHYHGKPDQLDPTQT